MKTVIGDLLDVEDGVILHQVNCRGVVGGFGLGETGPTICHVFGQREPGANTDLAAVDHALAEARALVITDEVFAPYLMGCSLGGGRWADYLPLLDKHFPSAAIIQLP